MEWHLGFVVGILTVLAAYWVMVYKFGMDPWNWQTALFAVLTAIVFSAVNERFGRPLGMTPPEPLYGIAQGMTRTLGEVMIGGFVLIFAVIVISQIAPRLPAPLYDRYVAAVIGEHGYSGRKETYHRMQAARAFKHFHEAAQQQRT